MSLVSKFLGKEEVDLYFSILKVPVDVLRFVEQIEHLPDRKLKIHLTEVEYPPEILKYQINNAHNDYQSIKSSLSVIALEIVWFLFNRSQVKAF